jgi:hypothetical protein
MGGVVVGILLGACLAAGKFRDLEAAYECLSHNVRMFLRIYLSTTEKDMIPVARQDFFVLRDSLTQADEVAGLAWSENRPAAQK